MRGCPICGGGFVIYRVSNYSYETCDGCHGVWMSRHTLFSMAIEIDESAHIALQPGVVAEHARNCPDCQQPMQKAWLLRIPVDYCEHAEHGIWFDGGELRQVLERVGEDDPPPAELPSNFRSLLGDYFARSGRR